MKMKTKLLLGSLVVVFMLVMLPSISAVEQKTIADANINYIEEINKGFFEGK